VHGSKDRAKDASPRRRRRSLVPVSGACASYACRRRSPPRRPPDIRCRRRAWLQRRKPLHAGGPTKVFVPTTPREERRLPEDRDAFHRHDTRRSRSSGGKRSSGLRAGSPAHAAHTFSPGLGESALDGHCKATVRSPAGSVTGFESTDAFVTRRNDAAPGTDDPSTPASSTDPAVDGGWLPRSYRCRSQRPDGFYDREPAARCAANFMSCLCRTATWLATKIHRAQSLFYPQPLSTAAACVSLPEIAGVLVFGRRIVRKMASNARIVDNNGI